jgi:hypothetical protein
LIQSIGAVTPRRLAHFLSSLKDGAGLIEESHAAQSVSTTVSLWIISVHPEIQYAMTGMAVFMFAGGGR